jgi:hypothetical protein
LLLRGLLETVVVAPAGRGRRVALDDRVRVLRFGAGVSPIKRGEMPYGLRPLALLDINDERVLRVASSEDSLQNACRVDEVRAHVLALRRRAA